MHESSASVLTAGAGMTENRVAQLDKAPNIEVLVTLLDASLSIFATASTKKHKE